LLIRYLLVAAIIVGFTPQISLNASPSDQISDDALRLSLKQLRKSVFYPDFFDKGHAWFSVGRGAYSKQYYARDTYVSFLGGAHIPEFRQVFSHSIDWFASHQDKDGYIPLWFRETKPKREEGSKEPPYDLNVYYFAPYNRTEENGGMKQYDHLSQFIHAIYLDFLKTNDLAVLRSRYKNALKAWEFLESRTDDFLLYSKRTPYAGPDWADQITRSGKAGFVNAYWYLSTNNLKKMAKVLGKTRDFRKFEGYAENIKEKYSEVFWHLGDPWSCEQGRFSYFRAWVDPEFEDGDFFEVDTNALALAVGLANPIQEKMVLDHIADHFDYYVNPRGASRVLCGFYREANTTQTPKHSHNGAYWYIVSHFLAAAFHNAGYEDELSKIASRANGAVFYDEDKGLNEWYSISGKPLGGETYSWSNSFPFFLENIEFVNHWR